MVCSAISETTCHIRKKHLGCQDANCHCHSAMAVRHVHATAGLGCLVQLYQYFFFETMCSALPEAVIQILEND